MREKVYTTTCLIRNGYETELFESPNLAPLHFCLWGWLKSEVYKIKVDGREELLTCISDAAACIKKRAKINSDDFRTRAAKCTQEDCGIFENVLRTVTNMSSLCIKFVI